MKLYGFPAGPFPRRIHIYLAEKGITEIEEVNISTLGSSWRSLSPFGTVPVLDTDDGLIRQSVAILYYLEERFPSPTFLGETPLQRARVRELMGLIDDSILYLSIWALNGASLFAEGRVQRADAAVAAAEKYRDRLRLLNDVTSGEEFIAGPFVSLADCMAMSLMQYAQALYGIQPPAPDTRLGAWYLRFSQRPSCANPPEYPERNRQLAALERA